MRLLQRFRRSEPKSSYDIGYEIASEPIPDREDDVEFWEGMVRHAEERVRQQEEQAKQPGIFYGWTSGIAAARGNLAGYQMRLQEARNRRTRGAPSTSSEPHHRRAP
jgi:hypothetical protein